MTKGRCLFVLGYPVALLASILSVLTLLPAAMGQQQTVVAVFNQGGVRGTIVFTQDSPTGPTNISVNLTGLPTDATFPWSVQQYPFPNDALPDPCSASNLGDIYDPMSNGLGNLSSRHGPLPSSGSVMVTDNNISLSGIYTIIGRSVVLLWESRPLTCANIGYPSSGSEVDILYVPFRGDFVGNVYFRQFSGSSSVATVYTDLTSVGSLTSSTGHNWHVHLNALGADILNCTAAGPHYNPRNALIGTSFYNNYCNPTNQTNCEVGDLSSKGAPFDIVDRNIRQLYTDTDLRLSGMDIFITGRSVVIHAANRGGPRIQCANISRFQPLEAVAVFDSELSGTIMFRQRSPFSPTTVTVNLTGLNNMVSGYHVHVSPVGPAGLGFPARCAASYTGGHWNPLNANYTALTPSTSDQYEVGDLSGKFGNLAGRNDVSQTYQDPNIPLFGSFGIIGRSIVIHQNNSEGTRLYCANIVHTRPVATFSYAVNTSSVEGSITMSQFADDPYSPTTIVVTLRVKAQLQPPPVTSPTPGFSSSSLVLSEASSSPVISSTGILTSIIQMTTIPSSVPAFPSSQVSMVSSQPSGMLSTAASQTFSSSATPSPSPSLTSAAFTSETGNQASTQTMPSAAATSQSVTDLPMPSTTLPVESVASSFLSSDVMISVVSSSSLTSSASSFDVQPSETFASESSELFPAPSSVQIEEVFMSDFLGEESSETVRAPVISSAPLAALSSSVDVQPSTTMSSALDEPFPVPSSVFPDEELSMSNFMEGDSSETMDFLMSSVSVTTPMPSRRRRRSAPEVGHERVRRQAMDSTTPFAWSLRSTSSSGGDLTDCANLQVAGEMPVNPSLCTRDMPLACSSGDLTAKHGTLNLPLDEGSMLRVVLTDSNLPLTGLQSPFSSNSPPALLVQPMGGGSQPEDTSCAAAVFEPPPTTRPPPTTPPPPATPQDTPPGPTMAQSTGSAPPPASSSSLVGPIVGAVGAAVVVFTLVIVVIIAIYCCLRNRKSSKYDMKKSADVELGVKTPSKPLLGVPNYRVLHPYEPQNEGDLTLRTGEWVTLEETPYGGGWWRGSIGDQSGWFPKTYVEYVDREAERKRKQEESFTLAAAAILDASSSFSSQATVKRGKSDAATMQVAKNKRGKEAQRRHTFSRNQIDSTPKMVTKFDKPYLERDDIAAMVIENVTKDGSLSGGSRPETPKSIRNNEIIVNKQAEDSENSQPDNDEEENLELTKAMLEGGDLTEEVVVQAEKYRARYDFTGTSEIELDFTSGSIILVIEKADNGWWRGIHKGQLGWFPESYMNPDSLGNANLFSKPGGEGSGKDDSSADVLARDRAESAGNEVEKPKNMDETMANEGGDLEASEYVAIHSYQSETEGDLVFSEGDTVWVYWGQENGWWYGSAAGKQGWFPESYVEPIIDTSTLLTEENPQDVTTSGQAEPATEQTNQQVPVEEKEEDNSLSNQLLAAVNKMKERSMSPPLVETPAAAATSVESEQKNALEPPKDELAQALAKRKSSQDNITAAASEPSITDKKKKTEEERVPTDDSNSSKANESIKQDEVPSTPAANDSTAAETPEDGLEDRPTSPEEDKEILLPKVDDKKSEKTSKPSVQSGRHPPPSGRSRRRPPPPPGSLGGKPLPATVPEEPEAEASSSPAITSRKSDTAPLLKPRTGKAKQPPKPTSPTKTTPPTMTTPQKPESDPLSQSPALSTRKSDTTPLLKTSTPKAPANKKPNIPKANTIGSNKSRQTVSGSKENVVSAGKQPRRTTAVDNRTKPRRRPPPPAPAALLSAPTSNKPKDEAKPAEVTPSSTPIPPPRAKARMKKVRRPSRAIPPPPSIPLPPPPSAKKVANTASKIPPHPLANASKVPPGVQLRGNVSPTASTSPAPSTPTATTPVDLKPISPLPARLGEESSSTPKGTPKGPRPPPPKRISSLHVSPASPLPPAGEKKEEKLVGKLDTVAKDGGTTSANAAPKKATGNSTPPKRPPPPRPGQPPSKRYSNPPTAEPPALPVNRQTGNATQGAEATEESGSLIAPRGSSLMGSLKRMVKRDSRKSPKAARKDSSSNKPQRPSQPPQKKDSVNSPVHSQTPPMAEVQSPPPATATATVKESPVPKPRTKASESKVPDSSPPVSPIKSSPSESTASVPLSTVKVEPPTTSGSSEPASVASHDVPSRPARPPTSSFQSTTPVQHETTTDTAPRTTAEALAKDSSDKPSAVPSVPIPADRSKSLATPVETIDKDSSDKPSVLPSVPIPADRSKSLATPVEAIDKESSDKPSVVSSGPIPADRTKSLATPAAPLPQKERQSTAIASGGNNPFPSPKPQPPPRNPRTSVTSKVSSIVPTSPIKSNPISPIASSPVETPSPVPAEGKRKSVNIPAKPLPPVTVSKGSPKPKPPIAPKPNSPSPLPSTGKKSFSIPPTSPSATSTNTSSIGAIASKSDSADAQVKVPSPSPSPGVDSPPANIYRASKDYNPSSSDELSLSEGDTVIFIEKRENGLLYGMKDDGTKGLFSLSHAKPFLK